MNFKDYINFVNAPLNTIVLNEGGAAGHMSHIFDDHNMTFNELADLVSDVFSGKIELIEKTDGQNTTITYKNGKVRLARNKATIKNPLDINETINFFSDRPDFIKSAFINSLKSLEQAFSKIPEKTLNKWFENGKKFMSAEIIYPPSRNVIDYGNRALIIPHNITEYDDNGNKISEDPSMAKEIYNTLEKADALNTDEFTISSPIVLTIKDSIEASNEINNFNLDLNKFLNKNNLTRDNTIQDYIDNAIKSYILLKFDYISENPELLDALINRYARDDKTLRKDILLKLAAQNNIDLDKFQKDIKETDNFSGELFSEIIFPLEVIVFKAAARFLKTLEGFVAANPDETISKLKTELSNAVDTYLGNPETPSKLLRQIRKVLAIGMENIVPEEGIVFKYKDKIYKMTGIFAPANNILGAVKFAR